MRSASLQSAICLALLASAAPQLRAQMSGRLVEDVDVTRQQDDLTVTLAFSCTLRYISHSPAGAGEVVQVRLRASPECGNSAADAIPPLSVGTKETLRSLSVLRTLGSEVELRIVWAHPEQFVVVPTFDGRGLRIRLSRADADRGNVMVEEVAKQSGYAVNLESGQEPFSAEAIAAAGQTLGMHTYVSEITIDGQKWYRLRAGPFVTEADARRTMTEARAHYPKSWIAVADDDASTATGMRDAVVKLPQTSTRANATTLTPADIDKTLKQARDAFRRKNYAAAIPLLTKLVEQPEFAQRAEAQELLALSRERSGQLAHAKAEYEEYLLRYPQGGAADRVRKRLRSLGLATRQTAAAAGPGPGGDDSAWKVFGGFSQYYRFDSTRFSNAASSDSFTTQNALLNDVGIVARRRGERFDFSTRVSAGYSLDLMSEGPGDQTRVTTFFAEVTDREKDWTLRAGRQSGNTGGLYGTYDGIHAGYQLRPKVRLNANFGYPVESTRRGTNTNRKFYGISADLGTFANAWDLSVYTLWQDYFGVKDRQALGAEVRYFKPGITVVGLIDYDLHFNELNGAMLLGTFSLPDKWTLNVNADRRKSPGLATGNAIIGQPFTRFDKMFGSYSTAELEQLARDRTAEAETYTVSVSRPIGERWQASLDVSSIKVSATPESGGVESTPEMGPETAVAAQAVGYGVFGRGDVTSIGAQYRSGDTIESASLGVNSQFPIGEKWRVGPRVRVDHNKFQTDGSSEVVVTPGLRAELRVKRFSVEFEGGAEIGSRKLPGSKQDTSRYYLSLGYRYDF